MCYGSGCSKENHMGDCTCFFVKDKRKIIKESEYKSECLIFGDDHEVIDFYLSRDEHEKVTKMNYSEEICNKMYNLALKRWREDKGRLKLIEQLEGN